MSVVHYDLVLLFFILDRKPKEGGGWKPEDYLQRFLLIIVLKLYLDLTTSDFHDLHNKMQHVFKIDFLSFLKGALWNCRVVLDAGPWFMLAALADSGYLKGTLSHLIHHPRGHFAVFSQT